MMKSLILIILLAGPVSAETFKVLVRQDHSTKTTFREVALEDLVSSHSFDGKYFRIVKGKNADTISFDDTDRDLVLKAANTYYHLTQARNYWLKNLQAERRIADIPKLTVRLEITNLYDDLGHFAHDNRDPQFNNAVSVPAGRTPEWVAVERHEEWGPEIWFRPKKVIDTREFLEGLGPNPLTQTLTALEKPVIDFARRQFQMSVIERLVYPSYASGSFQGDLIRFAGTIALTRFLISTSKRMDPLFMKKWFYIDTAMVPEVVYHEYAHVVLSDSLALSHSTPVNEGMADYFAAAQANKRKVYAPVAGRSNSNAKDPYHNKPYTHWSETNRAASSDFVLAVLWDVRELFGEELADRLIYQARKHLTTASATISDHLLRAILLSCEEVCGEPRRDKLRLYEKFAARGF